MREVELRRTPSETPDLMDLADKLQRRAEAINLDAAISNIGWNVDDVREKERLLRAIDKALAQYELAVKNANEAKK